MIHFVCICGEPFDVPADMAGDSMQCPVCKRLVDVPRLGEVDAFEDDGTLRLGDAPHTPSALSDKIRTFSHRDDLRPDLDDFLKAGTGGPENTPRPRPTPRYDPITGELMLPVGINEEQDFSTPQPILQTGAPVLGYARNVTPGGDDDRRDLPFWSVPWRLLTGWSVMAMVAVWGVHIFVMIGLMIPGFNIFFALPACFIVLVIVAHYCNTMEDFGPNDRDNVPVLLRSVSFSEDVWRPLWYFLLAGGYAFAPFLALAFFTPSGTFRDFPWLLYATLAWAAFIFPAALFTIICGGVIQNLLPHRVMSVVVHAPFKYVTTVGVFYIALVGYAVAIGGIDMPGPGSLIPSRSRAELLKLLSGATLTGGFFAAAVFLMHLAAAWMGMIYRAKHNRFNWVLQRHQKVHRTDVMARLQNGEAARPRTPRPPEQRHNGFEVKL